jgi:hypothetical protein
MPLGDEVADRLLANVEEDRRAECWWFVLGSGVPIEGDRGGGVALLSHLRLTKPIGQALERLGLSPYVDRGDRWLAVARGTISRFVPDGPAPRRYP